MSLRSLLTVFGFLAGTAAAVGTSNVFLLLGFGLYVVVVSFFAGTATPPDDATLDDGVDVVAFTHSSSSINGGTSARQ